LLNESPTVKKKSYLPSLGHRHGNVLRLSKPRRSDSLIRTNNFFLEIDDALQRATGVESKFEAIARGARCLGFEHCAYGFRVFNSFAHPKTLMVNNYAPAWQQRYREQDYLSIDPTVAHGVRSRAPLIWRQDVFKDVPQLWTEAREAGLLAGWAQSSFDATGSVGMLTLARSHEPLSAAEVSARGAQVQWLSDAAHQHLSEVLWPSERRLCPALTARELDVLRWTADGKTSDEVAILLGVSPNTVNYHVKNAIRKLRVANKAAAVACLARLRLLI
jgi:DNA-binding CsgD family transcriptional regulator